MLCVGGRCPIYVHTAHLSLQVVVAARIMACNVGGREVLLCNVRMRGCRWIVSLGIISKLLTHPEVYVSKNYEYYPNAHFQIRGMCLLNPTCFLGYARTKRLAIPLGLSLSKCCQPRRSLAIQNSLGQRKRRRSRFNPVALYGQQQCITNFLLIGSSLTKSILRITQCVLQRSSSTGRSAL